MPKRIEFEGQTHEFPDDFTDQEIQQALSGTPGSQDQAQNGNMFQFKPQQKNKLIDIVPGMRDPREIEKGAMQAAGLIGSAFVPEIPAIMEGAGAIPGIANMLSRMGAGGTFGAMADPEHPMMGGAIGAIGPEVLRAGGKAFNALRPSNLFRGSQTPEQLKNALNVTKGTETPIGDVIQSPMLKGLYENVIAKVPGSGAEQSMMKTGQNLVQKGEGIMQGLLGPHSPVNVEGELTDTLKNVAKQHRKLKSDLYEIPDKIAKDINLKLPLPNFSNLSKEYTSAIEDTNILKTEPEFRSLMNKLKGYQEPVKAIESKIVSKEGKPLISKIKTPSLKEANLLSSHLDDIAERYSSSINVSDRNAANVFKRLSTALKNDIKSGISASENKELINSFDAAEKNYAKNYSPFLQKDIYKFTQGKMDPDLIVQAFIKTGKATDRSNLLQQLVDKLPENKRKLLGYAYLKRAYNAKGEFDPLAFKQLISTNKLGTRQFELLFPGKSGKELKDYASLIEKNPEAFQLMKNPKTGARLSYIAALAAGMANPLVTLGTIGGANVINKLMTSPRIRESLINAMLKK